ncbi:MAG: hypothetical protein LBR76_00005, partial [Oscillospiraceae bacterium]|nr:hypothetical protein [Oscillospiraceae bacterium]
MYPENVRQAQEEALRILKSILNGMDAYIGVTVPETGELLFLNDKIKATFGIEEDYTGEYCYHLIQGGRSERCDFCPYDQLKNEPDKVITWENK